MMAAIDQAREAARRIGVVFVVMDIAQTASGKWVVIEVNDAQECGYAGVPPRELWGEISALERGRMDGGSAEP
jgi:glutathione synthase/RimK-type ligase-like ATP-grasp enzyme